MVVGWILLAMTREPASPRPESELAATQVDMMSSLKTILRRDQNFRRFIFGRLISQLALIGYAFYTVYAVSRLGVSETQIGWMTGVLMGTNVAANVTMGWLGDRIGHRNVMIAGLLSISASALLAWWALAPAWFFLVFILAGVGNVGDLDGGVLDDAGIRQRSRAPRLRWDGKHADCPGEYPGSFYRGLAGPGLRLPADLLRDRAGRAGCGRDLPLFHRRSGCDPC